MLDSMLNSVRILQRDFSIDDMIPVPVRFLKELATEAEKWKNNHDNQIRIKRTLMNRPDLKERAVLVQELFAEINNLRAKIEFLKKKPSFVDKIGQFFRWSVNKGDARSNKGNKGAGQNGRTKSSISKTQE